MILLDTNVTSGFMTKTPDKRVTTWFLEQKLCDLTTSVINIVEIKNGLGTLPEGKRRACLNQSFNSFIIKTFKENILTFDLKAANLYSALWAETKQQAINTDTVDLMIAAIAKAHNATLATRNVKDFKNCGIQIINPWDA